MTAHGFNHQQSDESKEEWLTPPSIIKALGFFDLDPCSPPVHKRPWDIALQHYAGEFVSVRESENIDGLVAPWFGRVWCNPPYGNKTFEWLEKCALRGNAIALIFARTDTKGFHREIFQKAQGLFFLEGRLSFYHVTGEKGSTANAPSVLVAYGSNNADSLRNSGLKGRYVGLS
jgi:hypothetical protein